MLYDACYAVALGALFPDKLTLALEIRPRVTEFVRLRIEALRSEHPGQYQNVSALRTNAMRYLPHYFSKGQLTKLFFCFPDPQFKQRNHRRRIVSTALLAEYAYLLAPGGILYTITDVEELHNWHVEKCTSHPCFTRISDDELVRGLLYLLVKFECTMTMLTDCICWMTEHGPMRGGHDRGDGGRQEGRARRRQEVCGCVPAQDRRPSGSGQHVLVDTHKQSRDAFPVLLYSF